ncbi:MAG TPA: zf-TFIIB domain-containing protein [Acidobacteriota bacterium]|nr:zf-TFIIB domain-containing protein [Acidobacteriota bacterium]
MVLDKEAQRRADQWFYENEKKLLEEIKKKREARIQEELAKEEERKREELKKLHWLKCPRCGHDMVENDLYGITVDVCTLCAGIFFERGEVEQLLQKKAEERKGIFRRLIGLSQ